LQKKTVLKSKFSEFYNFVGYAVMWRGSKRNWSTSWLHQ